jgi:hypothetical protein
MTIQIFGNAGDNIALANAWRPPQEYGTFIFETLDDGATCRLCGDSAMIGYGCHLFYPFLFKKQLYLKLRFCVN